MTGERDYEWTPEAKATAILAGWGTEAVIGALKSAAAIEHRMGDVLAVFGPLPTTGLVVVAVCVPSDTLAAFLNDIDLYLILRVFEAKGPTLAEYERRTNR